LVGDGAYASLAKLGLPRTAVISRLRRDAALYDRPAPRQPGQRGRPRKKGDRLPAPPDLAAQAAPEQWQTVDVRIRARTAQRLLLTRVVLW
ncbi:MAG TPA: transposase, partial [Bacillota bacterium]|nr:transposase [Bacillota bacterium]